MLAEPDLLRLNVLLAQPLEAVRIDEAPLRVVALTGRGEAAVPLHPTGRPDACLREVRALLSTRALGSPGGYPPYLRRWTRMGQARGGAPERLLLLGDPEAVAAVVHAPGLTEELARRAWWSGPGSAAARGMLAQPAVAASPFGAELADYLLEHLPFEERPGDLAASLARALAHPAAPAARRAELWRRAERRSAYAIGFLASGTAPPAGRGAHPDRAATEALLDGAAGPRAARLRWALGAPGQNFLAALRLGARRLPDQETAAMLFNAVGRGFALPGAPGGCRDAAALEEAARALPAAEKWEARPELAARRHALLCLAGAGESLLDPLLGVTDAVGSVMRRRLEPALAPLLEWAGALDGGG